MQNRNRLRAAALLAAPMLNLNTAFGREHLMQNEQPAPGDVFGLAQARNGVVPRIRLNSGRMMPIVGLGTYSLRGERCIQAVQSAVQIGYRKFDSASFYGNERELGEALRSCGVPREELFVATKLYPNQFADAPRAIEESLARLNLGCVDLMLLHHPGAHDVRAYRAMERVMEEGRIRSLGLSNFYEKELTAFLPQVSVKPVLVQNEIHPYYQDREATRFIQSLGIVVEAWYPLGGRCCNRELLHEPVLAAIAKAHGVSPVQVILRWDLQRGVAVVPGSSNPAHQRENLSLFDFELSDEEMEKIASLDRKEKHDWY